MCDERTCTVRISHRGAELELMRRRPVWIINLAFRARVRPHLARLRCSCHRGRRVTKTTLQMLLSSAIHKRAFGRDNGLRHA